MIRYRALSREHAEHLLADGDEPRLLVVDAVDQSAEHARVERISAGQLGGGIHRTLREVWGPPAEYVRATRPCEHCRGRGLVEHPTVRLVHDVRCPTCDGEGRERIAIWAPCECPCRGISNWPSDYPCTRRDCRVGYVLLGTVKATLVVPLKQIADAADVLGEFAPDAVEGRFAVLCDDARRTG